MAAGTHQDREAPPLSDDALVAAVPTKAEETAALIAANRAESSCQPQDPTPGNNSLPALPPSSHAVHQTHVRIQPAVVVPVPPIRLRKASLQFVLNEDPEDSDDECARKRRRTFLAPGYLEDFARMPDIVRNAPNPIQERAILRSNSLKVPPLAHPPSDLHLVRGRREADYGRGAAFVPVPAVPGWVTPGTKLHGAFGQLLPPSCGPAPQGSPYQEPPSEYASHMQPPMRPFDDKYTRPDEPVSKREGWLPRDIWRGVGETQPPDISENPVEEQAARMAASRPVFYDHTRADNAPARSPTGLATKEHRVLARGDALPSAGSFLHNAMMNGGRRRIRVCENSIDDIAPDLAGFQQHVLRLNPLLNTANNYLVGRIAYHQCIRYNGLLNQAIAAKNCSCGTMCISQGDSANVLDSKGNFPQDNLMPPTASFPATVECQLCLFAKKFERRFDSIKHIREDIQPFTCTWERCKEPPIMFKRKADWVSHENKMHRHLEWWTCDVDDCRDEFYRSNNFLRHLASKHNLAEPNAIERACGHPIWAKVKQCHQKTPELPKHEPCRFCGETFLSWKKLTDHLAKHMEDISLVVLKLVAKKLDEDTIIRPVQEPPHPPTPTTPSPHPNHPIPPPQPQSQSYNDLAGLSPEGAIPFPSETEEGERSTDAAQKITSPTAPPSLNH